MGAVLSADTAGTPLPPLVTRSPTANGATRQWASVDDFVQEVGEARIHAGIRYPFSIDAGFGVVRKLGELAVERVLQAPQ